MENHVRQSNLIENIDNPKEDAQSMKAWEFIKDRPHISQKGLLELHELITRNQLPKKDAGAFRRVHVQVGGRLCPDPELAFHQINNWLYDMTSDWKKLDPKDMHVRFEHIHPFIDGNGRTGRMLLWWHERKLGKEPTLVEFANRQEYYGWFK